MLEERPDQDNIYDEAYDNYIGAEVMTFQENSQDWKQSGPVLKT